MPTGQYYGTEEKKVDDKEPIIKLPFSERFEKIENNIKNIYKIIEDLRLEMKKIQEEEEKDEAKKGWFFWV